jgi:hypothetical protein
MVIIDRTNRNKLANAEGSASGDGPDDVPSQKIVDFESGRYALEKGALDEQQSRARLVERIRLPGRLSGDWLEFSLTMAIFFALLLGLYVRTHWFVAVLINLIVGTFVGERRGSMPRSPRI